MLSAEQMTDVEQHVNRLGRAAYNGSALDIRYNKALLMACICRVTDTPLPEAIAETLRQLAPPVPPAP